MFSSFIIVIVVVMLFASLPTWNYSRGWGYYPTGWLGLALVILFILHIVGKI